MSKYNPYSEDELDVLIYEPWEVSDQPYRLHASYALNSLLDLFSDESDEESDEPILWGQRVNKKILDRMVMDIADDFNDAAKNGKPIKLNGRSYSIRKILSYDKARLASIFSFPIENGEYIIVPEGVLDLSGGSNHAPHSFEVSKEESAKNRLYLRQVIMLADTGRWDDLTEMECIMYCWARFYHKFQEDNLVHFEKRYKDYLMGMTGRDLAPYLNTKGAFFKRANGLYSFSHDRVMEWNKANDQESVADLIPANEAEDYWYEVALQNNFRPIV